jgi:hypothetical protein
MLRDNLWDNAVITRRDSAVRKVPEPCPFWVFGGTIYECAIHNIQPRLGVNVVADAVVEHLGGARRAPDETPANHLLREDHGGAGELELIRAEARV